MFGFDVTTRAGYRRSFRQKLLHLLTTQALFVVAAVVSQVLTVTALGDESTVLPNIVFILADDLGYGNVGCYGQTLIRTPNIDRLAAEGLRFTQAYAGGPICAASRAVLMTGLHNGHAPARDNVPHYATYLQENDTTVAEILKTAGYRTGGVGKWSLGDAGTVGRAMNQGFDTWFGYLNQDHAHHYFTEYLDDDEERLDLRGNSKSHTQYSHNLMTDRALKFIRDADDDKRPFFLYVAYTLPHSSSRDEDEDGLAVPSTDPYSNMDWDEPSKKHAAMIHMIDRDIGRIVALVDSGGLQKNTLIVFTSDNGGHPAVAERFRINGALRGFKRDLTEGGIRVPFIARWPGTVPKNQVTDEVIAFQDMLPTFADLAKTSVPQNIDGISVTTALKGCKLETPREYLYWDVGHCRRRYDQAVRWGNWKGIRLGAGGEIQLYDLATDIGEMRDVAATHPEIVQRIVGIMKTVPTPSPRYPIGQIYEGEPLWKPN